MRPFGADRTKAIARENMPGKTETFYAIREFSTDRQIGELNDCDAHTVVSHLNRKYGPRFYYCEPKSKRRNISNEPMNLLVSAAPIHARRVGSATTICRGSLGQHVEYVDPATAANCVTCEFCLIEIR
jgi:hypothetical protein